jgi:putative FmdB family regulatory protein
MPTYEYECENCGVRFERLQRMSDAALTVCPECGGHVHRVMQPVGVIFKGSGFYVTDSRGKSSTGMPPKKKEDESKPAASEGGQAPVASASPAGSAPATTTTGGSTSSTSAPAKDGKGGS